MGFFKKIGNIFKKKPGGSFVGNIIRSVTKGKKPAEEGQPDNNWVDVVGEVAGSVATASAAVKEPTFIERVLAPVTNAIKDGVGDGVSKGVKTGTIDWLKKYWWVIALPGGLIIGLVIYLAKRKPSYRRR